MEESLNERLNMTTVKRSKTEGFSLTPKVLNKPTTEKRRLLEGEARKAASKSPKASMGDDKYTEPLAGNEFVRRALQNRPLMAAIESPPLGPVSLKVSLATDPDSDKFYAEIFMADAKNNLRQVASVYFSQNGFSVEESSFSPIGRKGFPSAEELQKTVEFAKEELKSMKDF
jgi:hypothetical protein